LKNILCIFILKNELFFYLQEVEDLAGALLSRMADTNKFLRADSAAALEAMVKNINPVKTIAALVNRGAK
jgi:hypothetical protein